MVFEDPLYIESLTLKIKKKEKKLLVSNQILWSLITSNVDFADWFAKIIPLFQAGLLKFLFGLCKSWAEFLYLSSTSIRFFIVVHLEELVLLIH